MHSGVSSLEDLAALAASDLQALYGRARTPALRELDGDLEGRMLAVPWAGPLRGFLRWLAARRSFPWRGKNFKSLNVDRGAGINRLFGAGQRAKRWFPFETSVGPSRAGDFDAVQLDYDTSGNPFFVRIVKDEVREIAPGLWLGQAYALVGKRPRLVAYFGLRRP